MSLLAYASNYLSESLVVPNSLVSAALPTFVESYAKGSWRPVVQGVYSGTISRDYVVRCSLGDPALSFFDWSDTGGTSWNATDIPVIAWQGYLLSFGISIVWTPGTFPPGLATGDEFRFHVERPYPPGAALDGTRETEFRSGPLGAGATWTVTFPFGVPMNPKGFIAFDHNWPSSATIRLQASATSNFATLSVNLLIPWGAEKILQRIGGFSWPYWRLLVTVATPVDFLRVSGLYLGDELIFSKEFDEGFRRTYTVMAGSDSSILARGPGRYGLDPQRWELTFGHRTPANDLTLCQTLWTLTHPRRASQQPFYLYFDSVPSLPLFELVHLEGDMPESHNYLDRLTPSWSLLQLIRTAA